MTQLLQTEEEQKLALSNLKTLQDHPGWQLLKQIVEENIKLLRDQILEGGENETKEDIDRKRDKLKAYKDVIETPEMMIKRLSSSDPVKKEDDPYFTVESLAKARKNT